MAKRMCLVGLCVVASLFVGSGIATAGEHYAVLCGVADYLYVTPDLSWTVKDAQDLRGALLSYSEQWTAEHINLLTESAATKAGIQAAINAMGSKAAPGDVFVFFFSGHGTQVRDVSGEEADRYDEAICPYDTWSTISVIRDDELAGWLAPISEKGAQVVAIFDTCFSGGMAKAKGVKVKSIRMPGVPADAKAGRSFGFRVAQRLAQRKGKPPSGGGSTPSQDIGGPNCVVLMACKEGQYSYETGDLQNGVFSHYVVEALNGLTGDGNKNGNVTAEEDYGYAAPKTTAYESDQEPQLYDGNPTAQVVLVGAAEPEPEPPSAVAVSVTTDKPTYTNRNKATITVKVTDGPGGPAIEGATVQVTVTPAIGKETTYEGTTDSAGIVIFTYTVDTKTGGKGIYHVDATATKLGVSGNASTSFTVK